MRMKRVNGKGGSELIDERTARAVLAEAQRSGADYAELFLEDTESNRIQMLDGKVDTAAYTRLCGAGVRVLEGTRSAYAYTADTSERALLDTARAAAAALGEAGKTSEHEIAFSTSRYHMPAVRAFDTIDNADRVALVREAALAAKAVSPEITQVVASYLDLVQRVTIVSTDGVFASDERPRTRVAVQAVAMKDGEAQTGFEAPGCAGGFEVYQYRIDAEQAGKNAAETAITMLHAPDCPAGFLPVVIDGGFGGVIFH